MEVLEKGTSLYNTSSEQEFIDEYYPKTPNISVDYAIMEKADNVYTIPSDIAWSDLGTWNSLYAFRDKDANANVVNGDTFLEDTNNCLIRIPKDKLAVIKGLEDYIIIDEKDVLLIFPKHLEQEIKPLVKKINKEGLK